MAADKPAPPAPTITISVVTSSTFSSSTVTSLATNSTLAFLIASVTLVLTAALVKVAPVIASISTEFDAIISLINCSITGSVKPDSLFSITLISFISEFSKVTSTLKVPYLPLPSPSKTPLT